MLACFFDLIYVASCLIYNGWILQVTFDLYGKNLMFAYTRSFIDQRGIHCIFTPEVPSVNSLPHQGFKLDLRFLYPMQSQGKPRIGTYMGLGLFSKGFQGNQLQNLIVQALPTDKLSLYHHCIDSTPKGIHAQGLTHP